MYMTRIVQTIFCNDDLFCAHTLTNSRTSRTICGLWTHLNAWTMRDVVLLVYFYCASHCYRHCRNKKSIIHYAWPKQNRLIKVFQSCSSVCMTFIDEATISHLNGLSAERLVFCILVFSCCSIWLLCFACHEILKGVRIEFALVF